MFYKENFMGIVNEDNVTELDFKDWIMLFDDCEDKLNKFNNLKKWLKFKSCHYPDPDCVLKQNAPKCVADKLNWYVTTEKSNKYFIDCIFSLSTFFKALLRYYANEYMPFMGQVYENFDKIFNDDNIDNFCKKQKIERELLNALFKQLNMFARNTHTLGNYMPCPDNEYNKIKGNYNKYKDRLEILYKDIQDSSKEEYRWFDWFNEVRVEKLELTNILKNENLLEFAFNGNEMGKEDIKPYTKYLESINTIIEERGKSLVKKLN